MGMIKDVTDSGLLQVELENEKILNYSIKEIKLLLLKHLSKVC